MSEAPARTHAANRENQRTEARDRSQEAALQEETVPAVEPSIAGLLMEDRPADVSLQRHASVIGDPRLHLPANVVRRAALASQMQRNYGNSYMNQVINLARATSEAPAQHAGLSAVHGNALQRDLESELSEPMQGSSTPEGRAAIQERRERMEAYVRSLEPAEARRLLRRLEHRRPGDSLSELFYERLSSSVRRGLLEVLREAAQPAEAEAEASEESREEEAPAGESAAPPAASGTREMPEVRLPIDLNRMRFTLAPMPYGPITITPSLRLNGTLVARPTDSALARVARLNLRDCRLEMAQSFGDAWGSAGYEFTSSGLAVDVFDRRFNMRMKIVGNTIEFEVPADNISSTQGDWRFEGSMGMVLALQINGNPAVVEAVVTTLSAAATVAAMLAAMARWGAQLAEAVGPLLEGFATQATRLVPIIVIEPVIRGYMEEQERGPSPIA